jgi:hypothetical protein
VSNQSDDGGGISMLKKNVKTGPKMLENRKQLDETSRKEGEEKEEAFSPMLQQATQVSHPRS